MALVFRPLVSAATKHRKVAQRLASRIEAAGASGGQILFDGYLFKASRAGTDTVVYVLDPEAVWVFFHHDTVPSVGTFIRLGARLLDRGRLLPGAPFEIDAPVAFGAGTALLPYSPGQGYYTTIDLGALFLRVNFPSVPFTQAERAGSCVLAATSGNIEARFSTDRFQLWGDVVANQSSPKLYSPGADTSNFAATNLRLLSWLVPEAGLATLLGDSDARYYTRQMSRYTYEIPIFGAQCCREGYGSWEEDATRWGEVIIGGAYVSQPTSVDSPAPSPASDPARLGIAGVFIAKLLRPAVPPSNSYVLAPTAAFSLLMTANPEPELQPVLGTFSGVNRYEAHGVSGAAMCFTLNPDAGDPPDGGGSRGQVYLFYTCHCNKGGVTWTGVQLRTMPSTGVGTTTTLYKGSTATGHQLGPDVPAYGVDGVFGATFSISAGRQDQTTTDLVHYGVDGTIRVTGLRAAGWYPFTQDTIALVDSTVGTIFGQSSHFAAAIGNGRVAIIARDYVVPVGSPTINWSMVVIDQATGAFIEVRGAIGTAIPLTHHAHIAVVTPETDQDPAVLVSALGPNHYVSTDGGFTWIQVFDNFIGKPLYLGNQLHEIRFAESL